MNRRAISACFSLLFVACAGERELPGPIPGLVDVVPGTAHPPPLATGVPLDSEVRISFNGPLAAESALGGIIVSRQVERGGSTRVAGSVFIEDGRTLVFVPAVPFAPSTVHAAQVAPGVRDWLGRPLREGDPFRWTFETGAVPGAARVGPALVAASPEAGAEGVSVRVLPELAFSHRMDPASLEPAILLRDAQGAPVTRSLAFLDEGRRVRVIPAAPLRVSATYAVSVTTAARSLDGVALAAERRWTFRTSSDPTHGAPLTITAVTPADGATNVVLRSVLTARFTRVIRAGSLSNSTFRLECDGAPVAGTTHWDEASKTATFTPSDRLAVSATYRATLDGIVTDEGLGPERPRTWTFETSADAELGERPRVVDAAPPDGALDVARDTAIRVVFSKPIDAASLSDASVELSVAGARVAARRDPEDSGRTLVLRPDTPLEHDALVNVVLSPAVLDREGRGLVPAAFSFRTIPDRVAPFVISTSPPADATEVAPNTPVRITVSELIDAGRARLRLVSAGAPLPGETSWEAASRVLSFVPAAAYPPQATIAVTVEGLRDSAGNSSDSFSYSFRAGGTPDTSPPSFDGVAAAIAEGETSAVVTWAAATDLESPAITYRVWFARAPAILDFSQAPAATTAAGELSLRVTGLVTGATYVFAVRAEDGSGNRETNTRSSSVTLPDLTPPAFAGVGRVDAVAGEESLFVGWSAAVDNVSAASEIRYRVYVVATSGAAPGAREVETAPGELHSKIGTMGGVALAGGSTYVVFVRAVDAAGNESTGRVERAGTVADIRPPIFDGAFSATAVARDAIRLDWAAASDAVTRAADLRYSVQKRLLSEPEFDAAVDVPAGLTQQTIAPLVPGERYRFRLTVRDAAGNEATHATQPEELTDAAPPLFEGGSPAIAASSPGPGEAIVIWNEATDARSAPVSYLLHRSQSQANLFSTTPVRIDATSTSFARLAGGTWFFGVRAQDAAGNRDTNTQRAQVVLEPPPMAYAELRAQVLVPAGCLGCHDWTHEALTTRSACGMPLVKLAQMQPRVGDPLQSYLFVAVAPQFDGAPERCSSRMPRNGQITAAQVEIVRQWIAQGAAP